MARDVRLALVSTHGHDRADCATMNLCDGARDAVEEAPLCVNKEWETPPSLRFRPGDLALTQGDGMHWACHVAADRGGQPGRGGGHLRGLGADRVQRPGLATSRAARAHPAPGTSADLPRRPMPATLHRPEPILDPAADRVDRRTSPREAAARLRDGESLLVDDAYGTGATILGELQSLLRAPPEHAPYGVRQAHRRVWREASLRLLAPIEQHRVALADAAPIGFLAELYPELDRFALPLVEVQSLRGAWNLHREGVHLAVLGHRVHPYYGTYAPTRTSHLELFGTWLSQYEGPRARAIDVGTGCGVLALMLCKAGFERVLATDDNPNAIESVRRELGRRPEPPPIDVLHGDLLGEGSRPVDLVVFNPPWTKGTVEGLLDRALYFEDGLFERFFEQAHGRLAPTGRVVLLFSNLIELVQPQVPHPIEAELARGRFGLVQKLTRKVKPPPDESGRRRRTRERVEVWELAGV